MVVCGPTAAGKTTLINALGAAVPASERIVTIEDTPEVNLKHPDWVPLFARTGNVEGAGAITYRTLMRTALRLRPTYLLVGEVRGAECVDMLASMATGHASMSTVHARSPRGALKQLATFAQMGEEHLSREAIAEMIAGTIELVIQLQADPRGTGGRQVVHILEVTGLGEGSTLEGHDLWTLGPADANGAAFWLVSRRAWRAVRRSSETCTWSALALRSVAISVRRLGPGYCGLAYCRRGPPWAARARRHSPGSLPALSAFCFRTSTLDVGLVTGEPG